MIALSPIPNLMTGLLLLVTSAFGVHALHIFSLRNGVFDLFFSVCDKRVLPGGNKFVAIDTNGRFPTADKQICAFAVFMLAFTDNLSHPDATLVGFLFLGAWGPCWVLIVLESFRQVNSGGWLSYLAIPGYIIFHYAHAFGTPLYLALLTLFTPSAQSWNQIPKALFIPHHHLTAIPISFILGYVIPIILISLPAPRLVSFRFKHTVTGLYQQWHLIIAFSHYSIVYLLSFLIPQQNEVWSESNSESTLAKLKPVYATAFLLAAVPWWTVTTLSFVAYLAPSLFNRNKVLTLQPQSVLIPTSPFRKGKVPDMKTGFKWLIQWDYIIGTLGTCIWALLLRTLAAQEQGVDAAWGWMVPRMIGYAVLGGPVGLGVGLMWERDLIAFSPGPWVSSRR